MFIKRTVDFEQIGLGMYKKKIFKIEKLPGMKNWITFEG